MTKTMVIEGMACEHCSNTVKKALGKLEGVVETAIDLEKKTATIQLSQSVSDEVLTNTVTRAGYDVIEIH